MVKSKKDKFKMFFTTYIQKIIITLNGGIYE